MLSLGISMGLIAMLCWGVADFLQALLVKTLGSVKNILVANTISLIGTIIMIAAAITLKLPVILNLSMAGLVVMGCIIQAISSYFFSKSYEEGEISVITPISGSFSLVTVLLAFLFLGEVLSLLQMLSVFIIILGIALASTDISKLRHIRSVKGIKEVLIAVIGWGIYFFILSLVTKNPSVAAFSKTNIAINIFLLTNLFGSLFMVIIALLLKKKMTHVKIGKRELVFFAANFFLYNGAWVAMNIGLVSDMVSLLAPVSSLYPAVTVILAAIFYKEKLVKNQYAGILIILLGIFMISL